MLLLQIRGQNSLWRILLRLRLAVKAIHRRRRAFFQNHVHRLCSGIEHFVNNFQLRLTERRQNVVDAIRDFMIRRNPQPYAQDLLRTQGIQDRFHPVMPRRAPALANPNPAQRQIQLVVNHDQVTLWLDLVFRHQFMHRQPAQVHVGLWLSQQDLFRANHGASRQSPAVPVANFHAVSLRQTINRQETQVMRRELILNPRVAQPDYQFQEQLSAISSQLAASSNYGGQPVATTSDYADAIGLDQRPTARDYFFSFSFFSAGAASAPSSPSASCLPFLITSGSAGAAPASA